MINLNDLNLKSKLYNNIHNIIKSVLKQNKKYINICAKYINICKSTERPREKYIPSYWLILGRGFGGREEWVGLPHVILYITIISEYFLLKECIYRFL